VWRGNRVDRRKNGILGRLYKQPYYDRAKSRRIFGEIRQICSRQAKCAKKRVLKVKRPTPDLDIFEKIPFYPFSFSGIYSRLLSGDDTENGVNVAKISKVSKCKNRQNQTNVG